MVKPEAEIANSSRVPSARDRKPDSGIAITSAIRYDGLHPRHLGRTRRQAGLDLGERRRDDLDVQDRHEHPEHHDQKREQPPRRDALGRPRRRSSSVVAVVASAMSARSCLRRSGARPRRIIADGSSSAHRDRHRCRHRRRRRGYRRWHRPTCPARSRFCLATSFGTRTRTGSRCTILVKLPVALSGGSSVNTEPAAGEMLSTTPANLRWP